MTRIALVVLLSFFAACVLTATRVLGQEPTEEALTPTATVPVATGEPEATATPAGAIAPTPVGSPAVSEQATNTPYPCESLPSPTPVVATSARISSRLVVDDNGNGRADEGDHGAHSLVELVIWAHTGSSADEKRAQGSCRRARGEAPAYLAVDMFSDREGNFSFEDVPAGDYSVWVWWAGGFREGGTALNPELKLTALRVEPDGSLGTPDPLPEFWPETYGADRIDVTKDNVLLGQLPPVILLHPAPANVVPYPVGSNTLILGEGAVDVGAFLSGGSASLPVVGTGGEGESRTPLAISLSVFGAVAVAGAGMALRSRRRS